MTGAAAAASAGLAGTSWSIAGVLNRVKNILLTPKTEWPTIAEEPTSIAQLYIGYLLPLTAWAVLISLLRLVFMPTGAAYAVVPGPRLGLGMIIWTFVSSFILVFLVGVIVNFLAPTFGGRRNQTQALKVAAYCLTPAYVGSVLALSPVLPSLLEFIVLCYGLYVLYLGLPVVMSAPKERALGYTATVVICTFLLMIVFVFGALALGITGHAVLGNNAADKAASEDQSAAILGNGVGNILGTDAKGKAGITAAVSSMIKAGEDAAPTSAPSGNGLQNAAPANSPADAGQNAGAAVGGLLGALGGALGGDHPKQAVDFKSLTPVLPADLPGMKRTSASGESQGALGIKTTSAKGIYQSSSGTVNIEITDMSAVSGLMGMAGALVQSTTSESDTGFERDQVIGGRTKCLPLRESHQRTNPDVYFAFFSRSNSFFRFTAKSRLAGAYQTVGAAAPVFHPVPAPESSELQQLVAQIAARIGHALEGRGLVERDLENAWLSADTEAGPVDDLLGHSITYRIAVGPRAGQKLFALQTVPPRPQGPEGEPNGAARAGGFS
jgi:hypothetical protein